MLENKLGITNSIELAKEEERITKQIEEFKGIEIVDKRKYGRAYVLFLKKMNGKEE